MKKILFMFTFIFILIMPLTSYAGNWNRSDRVVNVSRGQKLGGSNCPNLVVGYSSSHTEDLTFSLTLTGATWLYDGRGDIMQGVHYEEVSQDTIIISVEVGPPSEGKFPATYRNLEIPLKCEIQNAGKICVSVNGVDSSVSSVDNIHFANCIDGTMNLAIAKAAKMKTIGQIETIHIQDTSTLSIKKDKKIKLTMDNAEFVDCGQITGSFKYENIVSSYIDANKPNTMYITFSEDTPNEKGSIQLSNVVIKRKSDKKFNSLLMRMNYKDDILDVERSVNCAGYIDEDVFIYEPTTQTSTETTTEQTTLSNKEMVVFEIGKDTYIDNGTQIKLDSPAYINIDGYTMLPFRVIADCFKAEKIDYEPNNKIVTIIKGDNTVELNITENTLKVNNENVALETKAEIINGRTFLPLRAVAKSLSIKDEDIVWEQNTKTVKILK